MSATIIPFPSHRFTVVDAARLHEVASAMIATGIWGRVQYVGAAQGPGFDTVLIYLPDSSNPIFIVERQTNGSYSMVDCTTMSIMASARTLDGALAPLETVIRLVETAHGPVDLKRLQWNFW
ncbi:MAG: hypothetical protein ACKVOI_13910 [Dongiaceae bacterium]